MKIDCLELKLLSPVRFPFCANPVPISVHEVDDE